MGAGTELIFIEGHSKDDTYQAIEAAIARHPERSTQLFRQEGVGKGDAVRLGFRKATGDVLMILDADLTVASRGPAALLRGAAIGRRGVRQRRAARVPDGKGGDALLQSAREQVLQPGVLVASRPVDQGHPVRNQGAEPGRTTSGSPPTVLISATSIRSATSTCSSARRGCRCASWTCQFGTGSGRTARRTSSAGVTGGSSFACCCSQPAG